MLQSHRSKHGLSTTLRVNPTVLITLVVLQTLIRSFDLDHKRPALDNVKVGRVLELCCPRRDSSIPLPAGVDDVADGSAKGKSVDAGTDPLQINAAQLRSTASSLRMRSVTADVFVRCAPKGV